MKVTVAPAGTNPLTSAYRTHGAGARIGNLLETIKQNGLLIAACVVFVVWTAFKIMPRRVDVSVVHSSPPVTVEAAVEAVGGVGGDCLYLDAIVIKNLRSVRVGNAMVRCEHGEIIIRNEPAEAEAASPSPVAEP